MTKYFTKFHPENANGVGYVDKMKDNFQSTSVVVTKDGKPFELATFKRGYPSAGSHKVHAMLWVHDPKTGEWYSHGCKIQNGTETDAVFTCTRALFESSDKSGAHYSVRHNLEGITDYFGFKNYLIVG